MAIVSKRVGEMAAGSTCRCRRTPREEIARVVDHVPRVARRRDADGKMKLKTPSGSLSTAEAIAVDGRRPQPGRHFDGGKLERRGPRRQHGRRRSSRTRCRTRWCWRNISKPCCKKRPDYAELLPRAERRDLSVGAATSISSASAITGRAPRASLRAGAATSCEPGVVLIEGPADARRLLPMLRRPGHAAAGGAAVLSPRRSGRAIFWPFAEYLAGISGGAAGRLRNGAASALHRSARRARRLASRRGRRDAKRDAPMTTPQDGAVETIRMLRDPIGALAHGRRLRGWRELVARLDRAEPGARARSSRRCRRHDAHARGRSAALPDREAKREAHMRLEIAAALQGARRAGRGRLRRLACAGASQGRATAQERPGTAEGLARARARRPGRHGPGRAWRSASGYGAGVVSPGWCKHLWRHARRDATPSACGCAWHRARPAARRRAIGLDRLADRSRAAGRSAGRDPRARRARASRKCASRASPRCVNGEAMFWALVESRLAHRRRGRRDSTTTSR